MTTEMMTSHLGDDDDDDAWWSVGGGDHESTGYDDDDDNDDITADDNDFDFYDDNDIRTWHGDNGETAGESCYYDIGRWRLWRRQWW